LGVYRGEMKKTKLLNRIMSSIEDSTELELECRLAKAGVTHEAMSNFVRDSDGELSIFDMAQRIGRHYVSLLEEGETKEIANKKAISTLNERYADRFYY
jgi:hypothetical protein